jgi:hypothetical protein
MSSNLKLTYKEVWTKVGDYLGIPNLVDTADIERCKQLVLRGYRRFLMPIDSSTGRTYRWAFLQRTTTLDTAVNVDTYKLPVGFSALITPFTHTVPVSYNPVQKPLDFIYVQKSLSTGTGYPRWFAIKTGDYNTLTGQTDEVVFFPPPSAVLHYYYTYVMTPNAPVNDNDYFIGCELASEVILECSLAAAETFEKDGVTGQSQGLHEAMADRMLQQEIGEDKRQSQVGNLGQMKSGKTDFDIIRTSTVYLDSTQVIPETS